MARQISAYVSEEIKARLDETSRTRGLRKAYLVEQALAHHLSALEQLPLDVIIPPVLVVGREDFDALLDDSSSQDVPEALAELWHDHSPSE